MIIWGTKRVEKRLGYVAEQCPQCKSLRCFKVTRLGMASHVYFISLNSGRLLAHLGTCELCAGQVTLEPADYPAMEKNRKTPLSEMAARTNPLLAPTPEVLKREERLRAVRDPFLRFNQSLEDRAGKGTHLDWPAVVAILGTILVGFTLAMAASAAPPNSTSGTVFGWLAFAVFFGGFGFSFWLMSGESRRFFRKRLWPEIRNELAALQPDRSELDACLERMNRYRYRVARFVGPEELATIVARH